ncbi:WD40-repeat-containing domain [Pseudocohnilembus persalinus]|uniref:WD40-repeat-containing domain n=1 Tax=Pseudocohnilembus persalinus TaxID=266149 RepID=A0A0V0R8V1_PSEPJ|nr:WD40-repeat-containing domain [Pseudocohnilembus persalinus]|eukprot:KRX10632.1 WD40-repeat-containing domain [Pseudocohnilembus persalinus]
MLNTIYEEFDFESKIKDLKNKKIKIKRIIKKDPAQSIQPTSKPTLLNQNQTKDIQQNQQYQQNSSNKIPQHTQNSQKKQLNKNASLSNFLDTQSLQTSQILDENSNKNINNIPSRSQSLESNKKQPINNNFNISNIKNSVLGSSQILSDSMNSSQAKPAAKPNFLDRKINNNLFYSSEFTLSGGNRLNQRLNFENENQFPEKQEQQQYLNQNKFQIQNQGAGINDYQVQNPREKSKNPMFMSQEVSIIDKQTKKKSSIPADFHHLTLPSSVNKLLKEEEKNIAQIIQHLQKQKKKVDQEIDQHIREVLEFFNQARKQMHAEIDCYLIKYGENYEFLKDQVKIFKEKSKDLPTLSGQTLTDLQSISIFKKNNKNLNLNLDNNSSHKNETQYNSSQKNQAKQNQNQNQSYDFQESQLNQNFQKIKEEICHQKTSVDNIQREVHKKLMSFIADSISKSTYNLPLYNNTSVTQSLATEIKVNINKHLQSQLSNYKNLINSPVQENFEDFFAEPKISKVLSQDRYSVIGDFSEKSLNFQIEKAFQTTHTDTIMCIQAISNNLVATAGNDGIVEILDVEGEKIISTINLNYPVFSLGLLNSEKLNFDSRKNEDYLVAGGNQVNLFKNQHDFQHLKTLTIQNQQKIICMQEIKDSEHLALGGNEGKIYIHNVLTNKTSAILNDNEQSINSLVLTGDGMHLISGASDRKINIYKLVFDKQIFSSCHLTKTIIDKSQIFTLNASLFKSNMVFSAGSDCKIKLWNIQSGQLEREIVGHSSPISQMLLFENPFLKMQNGNNYQLITSGTSEEPLRITEGNSQINNSIKLSKIIENNWASFASPTMQLIRTGNNQLAIAIASQEERLLYLIQIQ